MNRLPSLALKFKSPYFMLHGNHPTYSSLRVFGSKCFPYTWDTKQNIYDPKTVLCIFVGYSDKHKGYKCFHPSSKKMIISRHVVFDESFFPYKQKIQNYITSSPTHVMSIFDSWLPPTVSNSAADIQPPMSTPPCSSSSLNTLPFSLNLPDVYSEQHASAVGMAEHNTNNVVGVAEHHNANGLAEQVTIPSCLNLHDDFITNTIVEQQVSTDAVTKTQQEEHNHAVGMGEHNNVVGMPEHCTIFS